MFICLWKWREVVQWMVSRKWPMDLLGIVEGWLFSRLCEMRRWGVYCLWGRALSPCREVKFFNAGHGEPCESWGKKWSTPHRLSRCKGKAKEAVGTGPIFPRPFLTRPTQPSIPLAWFSHHRKRRAVEGERTTRREENRKRSNRNEKEIKQN